MSTKTQFTPGPWHTLGDDYVRADDTGYCVAQMLDGGHCDRRDEIDEDERKANANLIAAAPELHEALRLLLAAKESDTLYMDAHWAPARAALAKAQGEMP